MEWPRSQFKRVVTNEPKYVVKFLMQSEFTKIIQNEILHVQCTTHKTVILLYKLTGITLYGHKIKIRLLMVNSLWATLCASYLILYWDYIELKQQMTFN